MTSYSSPTPPAPSRRGLEPTSWAGALVVIGSIIGLLWALEIVDTVLNNRLDQYGVKPRDFGGLWGIAAAPFLHVGFNHLLGNTVGLAIFGWLALIGKGNGGRFVTATLLIIAVSGLGVWLVAPDGTITIGASGVVFGWMGYLLSRGIFNRSVLQVLLAFGLLLFFSSMLWGLSPLAGPYVSWQGHLFGFAGGVLAAYLLADRGGSGAKPVPLPPTMPTLPRFPSE